MQPLGKIVKNTVQKKGGVANSIEAANVVETADKVLADVFPDDVKVLMKPLYIKNRTLTISCSSSAVAQELKLNEPQILEGLEKELGEKLVDRIRYFA